MIFAAYYSDLCGIFLHWMILWIVSGFIWYDSWLKNESPEFIPTTTHQREITFTIWSQCKLWSRYWNGNVTEIYAGDKKKFNYFKVDLFFWDAHCSYLSLNWVHVINLSECHGTHSIKFMALCMYIFYPLPVKREILVRISFIWCIGLFFISSIPNFEKI